MAHLVESEVQVTLSLLTGDDALSDRILNFKYAGGSIPVGRASKTEKKQLNPDMANMWICNPVISREHAYVTVEGTARTVYLTDNTSAHGTFVNAHNIKNKGKVELHSGDKIQFGDHVTRGAESFQPPVFNVQIKPLVSEPVPQRPSVGRSISVPDDSDDDSEMDESASDNDSEDSHSSPPGWSPKTPHTNILPGSSAANPFTIDEDVVRRPAYVIEDEDDIDEILEDPSVVGEASKDNEQEEQMWTQDGGFSVGDFEADHDEYRPRLPARQDSPVYRPASPPQHTFIPAAEPGATSYDFFVPSPAIPALPHYSQGPFAQQPSFNRMVSEPFGFATGDAHYSQSVDDSSSVWQGEEWHEEPFMPHMPTTTTTITASTQDFLVADTLAERSRISIAKLINPPLTTTGVKRKAADISDDDDVVDFESERALSPLQDPADEDIEQAMEDVVEQAIHGAIRDEPMQETVTDVVKLSEAISVVEESDRPAKRRCTTSAHIRDRFIAAAFGGIAMFVGLASLPKDFLT